MVDKTEIRVKAGSGGNGMVSFRREKFVPLGGPDGGDGGNGGYVYIMGSRNIDTLSWFSHRRNFRAEDGGKGAGRNKRGKKGCDLLIKVPLGTVVWREEGRKELLLADVKEESQRVLVAKGGHGGCGNARFASSTYQAPHIAQKGEPGEECALILDLKFIADVGIIGYPSVGKSMLLATASSAKPKIAGFPFTTKEPILGMVEVGQKTFALAEIPGIIEGAHLGRGLGYHFLRHSERTKMFIHVIDGNSQSPVDGLQKVNEELRLYNPALLEKPQVVAVNKIDLAEVQSWLPQLEVELSALNLPIFFISALTGQGVSQLMSKVAQMLESIRAKERVSMPTPQVVFHPKPRREKIAVRKEGDHFLIFARHLEKLVAMTDVNNPEARAYLKKQLQNLGAARALNKAGVKVGDKLRIGDVEIEWE